MFYDFVWNCAANCVFVVNLQIYPDVFVHILVAKHLIGGRRLECLAARC